VADVFDTLLVSVAVATPAAERAQFMGDSLHDLGVDACPISVPPWLTMIEPSTYTCTNAPAGSGGSH
jgi:hypothetical protein